MSKINLQSTITCPYCGFEKEETMPVNFCQVKYKCTNCGITIVPKSGDWCVYCSYGTEKCPLLQEK